MARGIKFPGGGIILRSCLSSDIGARTVCIPNHSAIFSVPNLKIYIYVYEYLSTYMCTMCVSMIIGAGREHLIPWN